MIAPDPGRHAMYEQSRWLLTVALLIALMLSAAEHLTGAGVCTSYSGSYGFGTLSSSCGSGVLAATPAEELVRQQAERLPLDDVEQYWSNLMKQYGGYFPDSRAPTFMELLSGAKPFSIGGLFSGLLRYFFHELLYNGKLLVSIVILTVFSMLLETLQSSFQRNAVSKIAYAISFLVLMILAINSFNVAIGYAKSAISHMIHFMVAVVPVILTLLASMGNAVSVTVMHPLIVFMVHTVGTVVYVFVFPLLFFSAVLHIVSGLSDKYKVTQLANLLRNISLGSLGVFITVFLGVISVQGVTGAVADGVTIRTAKYIAGNFVPVVGRLFSDASETVIGASLMVKNAVGLAGVVVILVICAFPALKIMALALIYNISAAVLQPLGDNPMITCLETIGKSMIYVFAALAVVGFMFFLAITILITAGNVSVMMR
ncbi:stage III sporulation protein AE [Paenibacillus sp. YYML68]|uniref:stage III sporulation protein AE n=1 Tax=Paenibacillus sp. YYML68 TaxID=2909250 RepID=UPI0037C6AA74